MQMNSNTPAQKNQLEITPVSDFLKNRGSLASIPINAIVADPIFQMRENGTDDVIVRRYAEVMQQNDPDGWQIFPRITVLSVSDASDERYCPEDYENVTHKYTRVYVVGGFHRLAAIQERSYEHIEAVIIHGSTADGIVFAAGENDDKSVRRTLKDLRNAVLSCLKHSEIKAWANPKIAEICAVDVQTVRNWELWLYKNDPDYSRPEKLKFRDKYGGVGLRKHSIPNFAAEDEKAEAAEKHLGFDDEYPNTSTEDLIEKQEGLRGEVFKFAIEKNGLPPGNLLIDWNRLLSHAEKQHKGIIRDELVDPDRDKLINQIKIWSHFAYQAGVASDIFVAMLANFDYEMAKRDGKRFPDLEECNWIVDLGLPNVLKEIISRTRNRYDNSQSDLGLASLPFYDDPGFYSYAEKQHPRYLVESHPALDTAEDRESNLGAIKTWYALGEDIRNRADWIQDIKREIDDNLAKEAAAEDGPDLQGLREEIDDCIVNGEKIETEELSKKYDVPIKQVNLEAHLIQQEKGKYGLMNAYDDLASKGWSIWDQHLKRFISWKELYEAAQSNWPALADWDEYSPSDESEESLQLQVAIWRNFNTDLDYAVRAIKKEGAERGNIWLLNLLVIDVEPKPDPDQTEDSDEQKRAWTMEEAEFSYESIEEDIGDLSEEEQVAVRQFIKMNYHAYPTYGWRDKLKIEALEALAETLDQIHRGIKEKGLDAFKLSAPSEPSPPTELQIKPVSTPEAETILLEDDTYTKEHLLNCKRSITELTELQGIPLIIKFAAEEFLETIGKALLVKDKEAS